MAARRVAVTGLGTICALGHCIPDAWISVCEGRSGIRPIEGIDLSGLRFQNGAQVRDYDVTEHFDRTEVRALDRFSQLALIAAREAILDAGVEFTADLRENTAVITGSGVGGQTTLDAGFVKIYREGELRVDSPLLIPRAMANAAAGQIAMEFGFKGPCYTISTACCSANHAIGQAFRMVRDGYVELAIAGASEAPFSFGLLKAFEAMRIISRDTCRPFSRDRRGLILGEGAAMLCFEPIEMAKARGATIYAEIVGYGMSADAEHLTHLSVQGPARAMRAALRDANIRPEQIGYINAHGSGTQVNDAQETRAVRNVFDSHADRLAISSTKALHGHALGGTGALEAMCTILALKHGVLPPTVNYTQPDPECDLDVIPNHARKDQVEFALSNSFAFGGLNAVLAFQAVVN